MKRTVVNPKSIPARNKPYSQGIIVEARRFLFVAGQVPIDQEGLTVGTGDVTAQCRQVFKNIEAVLKEAGANFSNIAQFTTFLVDSQHMPAFYTARNELYRELYPEGDYPTNTLLVIDRLASEDFLLEIEAIAALD
jgi:enamine deaminase RidA (YjgF/YER057c/UK114 family)